MGIIDESDIISNLQLEPTLVFVVSKILFHSTKLKSPLRGSILVVKLLFAFFIRNSLRNEIFIVSWLTVVVMPMVYVRNFSRPVSVDVFDRCSPLERS